MRTNGSSTAAGCLTAEGSCGGTSCSAAGAGAASAAPAAAVAAAAAVRVESCRAPLVCQPVTLLSGPLNKLRSMYPLPRVVRARALPLSGVHRPFCGPLTAGKPLVPPSANESRRFLQGRTAAPPLPPLLQHLLLKRPAAWLLRPPPPKWRSDEAEGHDSGLQPVRGLRPVILPCGTRR